MTIVYLVGTALIASGAAILFHVKAGAAAVTFAVPDAIEFKEARVRQFALPAYVSREESVILH